MFAKTKWISILFLVSTAALGEPLKLALNWKAEPQFGGFYQAELSGAYRTQGLDVEILQGGSGSPTLQMLLSGKAHYGIVSGDEILIAAAKHPGEASPIVALFAVYQTNPQAIMSREKGAAKNLEELFKSEGTLLWQEGLPYAQYLKKKYQPLKIKTAPYSGGIANFLANEKISQQCFATSEPLAAAKKGLAIKTYLVADAGYNPYTTVLAVERKYFKSHGPEAQKITKAVQEGWTAYLKDPAATNQMMAKLNPSMDAATFQQSAEAQKKLIQGDASQKLGAMTEARWQTLADQLKELQIIKASPAVKTMFSSSP